MLALISMHRVRIKSISKRLFHHILFDSTVSNLLVLTSKKKIVFVNGLGRLRTIYLFNNTSSQTRLFDKIPFAG